MSTHFRIYTDGSAIGNPGPGGWGAVLQQSKRRWEISGAEGRTTISEMELVPAIRALQEIPYGSTVELYSDSELLIRGMRFLVSRWRGQQWRNRRGATIPHRHHWEDLITLDERLDVRWSWVRGHSGHPMQTRADELAYQAARAKWRELRLAA